MSQFKLLMLAFLTIGYGVCTNSVVMAQTWQGPVLDGLLPGESSHMKTHTSTEQTHTFGARATDITASRTTSTQHNRSDTQHRS